jgi:hypothetical protein
MTRPARERPCRFTRHHAGPARADDAPSAPDRREGPDLRCGPRRRTGPCRAVARLAARGVQASVCSRERECRGASEASGVARSQADRDRPCGGGARPRGRHCRVLDLADGEPAAHRVSTEFRVGPVAAAPRFDGTPRTLSVQEDDVLRKPAASAAASGPLPPPIEAGSLGRGCPLHNGQYRALRQHGPSTTEAGDTGCRRCPDRAARAHRTVRRWEGGK